MHADKEKTHTDSRSPSLHLYGLARSSLKLYLNGLCPFRHLLTKTGATREKCKEDAHAHKKEPFKNTCICVVSANAVVQFWANMHSICCRTRQYRSNFF